MDDVIKHLETRILALIQQCENLQQTNIKLRHSRAQLVREKDLLLTKHKVAITQIETMVSRLKSIDGKLPL